MGEAGDVIEIAYDDVDSQDSKRATGVISRHQDTTYNAKLAIIAAGAAA